MKHLITLLWLATFANSLFAQYDGPESAVWDNANKRYYISNANAGRITQWTYGSTKMFSSGLIQPKAMVILDSTLYVCDYTTIKTYNTNTAMILDDVDVPGATYMNDMCVDTAGNFFITETYDNSIIKYTRKTNTYSKIPLKGSIDKPDGIIYDTTRLIIVSFRENSPIQAISLKDYTVSTLKTTDIDYMDGIQKDGKGNVFFSAWINNSTGSGKVYKMKDDFTGDSTVVVSNLDGPADILYNQLTDTLVIPCMNGSSVIFISFLDPPPAPVPMYPKEGFKNTGWNMLIWHKSRGAEKYIVEVADNPQFADPLLSIETTDTNFIFNTDKMCDTLFWRVKAINVKGESPWSETRFLTPIEPNPQTLVSPPDNMIDAPLYVKLKWNNNNGYAKVIIDTSATFETKQEFDQYMDTTFIVGPLLSKTKYYWKIIGITCSKEAESEVWSFTTIDASLPDKPALVSPANDTTDLDPVKPTFQWNKTQFADYYWLWVSISPDFYESQVIDSIGSVETDINSHQIKDTLWYEVAYYWKVVAHNKYGSTESDIFKFKTVKFTGVETDTERKIIISPNPASDYIEITNIENEISIFNILGECVRIVKPTIRDTFHYRRGEKIDVSSFPPGIYFVRVGDTIRKFVKL